MRLSVEKAVQNASFCYKVGGCASCAKNLKKALEAMSQHKKWIEL